MIEEKKEQYISLRFSHSFKSYTFTTNGLLLKPKDKVVVETKRGLEMGEIVSFPRLEANVEEGKEVKPILRLATRKDKEMHNNNLLEAKKMCKVAQEKANELGLDMQFIDSELTLDHSKITLTYLADNRVDFRELLKQLALIFHLRIDLRQVGSRDKARMVGGIGICGRELCCSKFMNEFERISINMAKNQLLALNIAKLSGHCGSLLCCLRYEDAAYNELKRGLPKVGSRVEYEQQNYRLAAINPLKRTCKIENEDETYFLNIDELMKNAKFKREDSKESGNE